MLEIEYEFREQDLLRFNQGRYLQNPEIQRNIRNNRWVVPGVMFLIGSFYYFYYGDRNTTLYVLGLALLWAWLAPKALLMDFRRQILNSYNEQEKAHLFGTYKLAIDPANPRYLLEKSPSGNNKMAWSELLRVEYGKRYVHIYLSLDTALVIPVDTVRKGNLEQFAEQVEKMIERHGD